VTEQPFARTGVVGTERRGCWAGLQQVDPPTPPAVSHGCGTCPASILVGTPAEFDGCMLRRQNYTTSVDEDGHRALAASNAGCHGFGIWMPLTPSFWGARPSLVEDSVPRKRRMVSRSGYRAAPADFFLFLTRTMPGWRRRWKTVGRRVCLCLQPAGFAQRLDSSAFPGRTAVEKKRAKASTTVSM